MSPQSFGEEMKRMKSWFRAQLNDEQDRMLYDRVSHIPTTAWREICQQIINTSRAGSYFPAPLEFSKLWNEWVKLHPDKVRLPDRTACSVCDGTGRIAIEYVPKWIRTNAWDAGETLNLDDPLLWYETDVSCAACDNWQLEFPTSGPNKPKRRVLPEDVRGKYERVAPPKKTFMHKPARNLEKLSSQAVQPVPKVDEGEILDTDVAGLFQ